MMLHYPQSYSTTLSHNPKFVLYVCKCSSHSPSKACTYKVYVHVYVTVHGVRCPQLYKCQRLLPLHNPPASSSSVSFRSA